MPDLTELVETGEDEAFILHPGEFVLGATLERVTLGVDLVARLEGKSSLGRLGLQVHSTAGFIDPGFDGHVTLELANVSNLPITLYAAMKVGQISFLEMTTPAAKPYGIERPGLQIPGPGGPDALGVLAEFQRGLSRGGRRASLGLPRKGGGPNLTGLHRASGGARS